MNEYNLDFFHGDQANQFVFYHIPKILIVYEQFKDISTDAKLLYGLMLDRMGLSVKNGWHDSRGRVYIYFSVADVMEHSCCGCEKATKLFKELKDIQLIQRKRQGQGKPSIRMN